MIFLIIDGSGVVIKKRKTKMITIQDLYNILDNRIVNEAQKNLIRNNMPPQIAERMCAAIDGKEKAEHF